MSARRTKDIREQANKHKVSYIDGTPEITKNTNQRNPINKSLAKAKSMMPRYTKPLIKTMQQKPNKIEDSAPEKHYRAERERAEQLLFKHLNGLKTAQTQSTRPKNQARETGPKYCQHPLHREKTPNSNRKKNNSLLS